MITTEIRGHTVEYFDDGHIYLVDGIKRPSITQILQLKFANKYKHVNKDILERASKRGTEVHKSIETYCKTGKAENLPEITNFRFLQRQFQFVVIENELPVVLFVDNEPVACGRLDLLLQIGDQKGVADIKSTSTLDKNYLYYQLNLYRIALWQSYGIQTEFLKGVHLKGDTRRFVDIPVKEDLAMALVHEYLKGDQT